MNIRETATEVGMRLRDIGNGSDDGFTEDITSALDHEEVNLEFDNRLVDIPSRGMFKMPTIDASQKRTAVNSICRT